MKNRAKMRPDRAVGKTLRGCGGLSAVRNVRGPDCTDSGWDFNLRTVLFGMTEKNNGGRK